MKKARNSGSQDRSILSCKDTKGTTLLVLQTNLHSLSGMEEPFLAEEDELTNFLALLHKFKCADQLY